MEHGFMRISGSFCFGLALALLLIPFDWLIAFVSAAAFHEFCHYVAIRILSGHGGSLRLYSYAAQLPLPPMSAGKELLCALAGPLGGLSLLLFMHQFPRLAICAAIQSIYNLLPLYPLDGGRALRCGLAMLLPPNIAKTISKATETVCMIAIFGFALYGCVWLKLGLFPLLLALLLFIRLK